MIELTPEGRELLMRANTSGHVIHRLHDGGSLEFMQGTDHITCTCGRLDEHKVPVYSIANVTYAHFNQEAKRTTE